MSYEVLVVDDYLQAAREFARLITVKTGIESVATDDPDEAIKILKSNPIKVALLDQIMPKKDGTELFLELKQIDPLLKGIMITGEADGEQVGKAFNMGFSDYIHKSKVESIIPRTLLQYCAYHTDLAESSAANEKKLYSYRRGWLGFRYNVNLYLITVEVLDEDYVFPDSWKTAVTVDAGERKNQLVNLQRAERFVIESEEKMKILGNASFKIPVFEGLTAKLETAVEERFKTMMTSTNTHTVAIEREFRLPKEPEDPGVTHVKSRQYEHAPVYIHHRLIIRKCCDCCKSREVIIAPAFHLTQKIANRQRDYMSDGSIRVIETGITL